LSDEEAGLRILFEVAKIVIVMGVVWIVMETAADALWDEEDDDE